MFKLFDGHLRQAPGVFWRKARHTPELIEGALG